MKKKVTKASSAKAASLAARVLAGHRPTRNEIETLAASVVAQGVGRKKVAKKRATAKRAKSRK